MSMPLKKKMMNLNYLLQLENQKEMMRKSRRNKEEVVQIKAKIVKYNSTSKREVQAKGHVNSKRVKLQL